MQVQVQVQPQQQIQESTSQQIVQQSTEQQIVQVSFFIMSMNYQKKIFVIDGLGFLFILFFQVQIQGQQQGQILGQVLQMPAGSHQQLQGVTTAQLIQPGDLTEEQQQQVCTQNNSTGLE